MKFFKKNNATKTVSFKNNGVNLTNKTNIANQFNHYFTSISHTIAQDIHYNGNKDYNYYLNEQVHYVFNLNNVDEETVKKTIESLPTKNSSGCDGISSKLLKII